MADNKKISELTQIQSLDNDDEFMVVDKSITSGDDASSTGKTTKVQLWQIKEAVSASGAKGDTGDRGNTGPAGPKGSQGSQGATGANGGVGADGLKGSQGVQGATGSNGSNGANGDKGAPGVAGAKGSTGPTGPKGSNGSQGPTGPTGLTGSKGNAGSTGPVGPKGSTGAKGSTGTAGSVGVNGNANSHMRLTRGPTKHADFDNTGQKLVKSSGGAGWNGSVYSQTAYSYGCYVSFTIHKVVSSMIGFNTDPTKDESYASIDYAFYPHGGGIQIYQSGSAQKNPATGAYEFGKYVPGVTIFTITYDNDKVRYMLDGVVVHAVNVGPAKRFYMDSSLHTTGQHTNMLAFGPMGSAGAKGNAGSTGARGSAGARGATGPRGATGATGGRGTTGIRGPAGSTASITTSTTINPGQVRLGGSTNSRLDDEGSWGFRSRTDSGYIQFGPANSGHAHIYTDRANFYFNRELLVNGKTVYHSGNSSSLAKTTGGTFTGTTYFNNNALRVKQSMLVLNEKGHSHTYISQDGNGFTRVAGQYGVGFIGRGVQATGKPVDSDELGRFTSLGHDLKGSSLLKIGCNTTNRPMARLDVGAHGSIFQRNGHYGDAMYLSTGAKFVHDGKDYRWSNSIKGHSCAVALARNGFNIWNSGAIFSPGQAPAYRLDFHMNVHGNLHIRGAYLKLSDIREKKNIKSLDRINSLDKVLKLNPVTFEWKDESIKGEKLGLIAQEVEAVVPNAVEENDTSTPIAGQEPEPSRKSIDYESLIPLLISSIQNQQQQINQLRKQLNSK
jgi:hypothetical protein